MRPLAQLSPAAFAGVDFVLTDMDDTLTYQGKLPAKTYSALERLHDSGVKIVPVTAAPAGWCDLIVRMWPVAAVIAENGGITLLRTSSGVQHTTWHDDAEHAAATSQLAVLRERIAARLPWVRPASDNPFRLTSIAFDRPATAEACADLCAAIRSSGGNAAVNSMWVLAWLGGYDKLVATRRFVHQAFALDIDADRHRVVYVGDSTNDAPMFRHFPHAVGVSTVVDYLHEMEQPPAWITRGPGGSGFVQVADAILVARS
jgi:hypothetical protein